MLSSLIHPFSLVTQKLTTHSLFPPTFSLDYFFSHFDYFASFQHIFLIHLSSFIPSSLHQHPHLSPLVLKEQLILFIIRPACHSKHLFHHIKKLHSLNFQYLFTHAVLVNVKNSSKKDLEKYFKLHTKVRVLQNSSISQSLRNINLHELQHLCNRNVSPCSIIKIHRRKRKLF